MIYSNFTFGVHLHIWLNLLKRNLAIFKILYFFTIKLYITKFKMLNKQKISLYIISKLKNKG